MEEAGLLLCLLSVLESDLWAGLVYFREGRLTAIFRFILQGRVILGRKIQVVEQLREVWGSRSCVYAFGGISVCRGLLSQVDVFKEEVLLHIRGGLGLVHDRVLRLNSRLAKLTVQPLHSG